MHLLDCPDEILQVVASYWPNLLLTCRCAHTAINISDSVKPMIPLNVYVDRWKRPHIYVGNQSFYTETRKEGMLVLHKTFKKCRCRSPTLCACKSIELREKYVFGSVLPSVRFPIAFFPAVLPYGAYVRRIFSMKRGREEYMSDDMILRSWGFSCSTASWWSEYFSVADFTGPHVVVYGVHGEHEYDQKIVVLTTSGVYFPDVCLRHDPWRHCVTRVWWYRGNLCVMSKSDNKANPYITRIWSFQEKTVVQQINGKRAWSKFRGVHKQDMWYPVLLRDTGRGNYPLRDIPLRNGRSLVRALAPDGVIRDVFFHGITGNMFWGFA